MEKVSAKTFYHIQKAGEKGFYFKPEKNYTIGSNFNPFYHYFYSKSFPECVSSAEEQEILIIDILNFYMHFMRETVFENVRKEKFPELPSRTNCLFLLADLSHLEYWLSRLSAENQSLKFQILELSCTGKIFLAHQTFLNPKFEGINYYETQALKYWSGQNVDPKSPLTEVLFSGDIFVKACRDII